MPLPDHFITVDPGLQTGLVCWSGQKIESYHTFSGRPNRTFHEKVNRLICDVETWLDESQFNSDRTYMEWPAVFGSAAGITAASSGSVVKLAFIVGRLVQTFDSYFLDGPDGHMEFIEVSKWKGQVPKDVMHKRIRKFLSPTLKKELLGAKHGHVMDAIGMGYHLWGMI